MLYAHNLALPHSSRDWKGLEETLSQSSSYELFVVSIMQEDVYIGYTALALTLFAGLQLDWSHHDGLVPPFVCHIKTEASR